MKVGTFMSDGIKENIRGTGMPSIAAEKTGFLPDVQLPSNLPTKDIAIAEMANAFGVTHRTLHFYEEKHLIAAGRSGLMRVYDRKQAARMAIVNACRETGMPVAGIQDLMEAFDQACSQDEADNLFLQALETRRRELTSEQSTVYRQMHRINELIEQAAGIDNANDNFEASDFEAHELHCLALMSEGYAPARLARALGLTMQEIARLEAEIIRKFGANNRFQAVAKSVLLGIIK
jgi:DNA-binding transcriptional MerR regulator